MQYCIASLGLLSPFDMRKSDSGGTREARGQLLEDYIPARCHAPAAATSECPRYPRELHHHLHHAENFRSLLQQGMARSYWILTYNSWLRPHSRAA